MQDLKNLLFDLDGTLIKPEEGILNSVIYSLKKMGITDDDREELKHFIGPPLIDSYRNRYNLSEDEGKKAVDLYRGYFSEEGLYQNELYPGIKELLIELKTTGLNLFVATSKPTVFSEKIIKNYGLFDLFTGIIGSNLDHTRNEKTEIISYIINRFKIKPSESLMIGDRKYDIIGAKNNGLHSAAVTYGYGNIEEFIESEPDFIIHSPEEIISVCLSELS